MSLTDLEIGFSSDANHTTKILQCCEYCVNLPVLCILGLSEKQENKKLISKSAENLTLVTSKLHAKFCKLFFLEMSFF
jgi:hypothetical protein